MLSSQFKYFSIIFFHVLVIFLLFFFYILYLFLIFVVNLPNLIKLVLSFFRKLIFFVYVLNCYFCVYISNQSFQTYICMV